MKRLLILSIFALIFGTASKVPDFYAYYTKTDTGQAWEEYSRTARHADLVVRAWGWGNCFPPLLELPPFLEDQIRRMVF